MLRVLSGMLADIIGKEEESAGRVIYALWSRCKALELVSEKTNYTEDSKLTNIPMNHALLYLITAQTLYLNFLVSLWTRKTPKT